MPDEDMSTLWLSGRRICLVTPGPVGSGPRLVKEADTLAQLGAEVVVVSLGLTDLAELHDRDARVRADARWRNVQLGRIARPLEIIRALAQRGARLLCRLGLRHPSLLALALHRHVDRLARAAARQPADLYIAHNLAALPAAAVAARRHGARLAFDAEDFHAGELTDAAGFQRRLVEAVEAYFLPGCDYVSAASPGIARAYAERYGIPEPAVVLNVFPRAYAVAEATPAGSWEPGPSLYWFSQTIGPDRGLETAVLALALTCSKPHLCLRGSLMPAYGETLKALAAAKGVADRLHFLPPASPAEMSRLASRHDLGLAAETLHTLNHRICLSNKLFTYLLAGVPVLVSDTPAQRLAAEQLGEVAMIYPDGEPARLAACIDAILLAPGELARLRQRTLAVGLERHVWEIEQARFLACVRKVLT